MSRSRTQQPASPASPLQESLAGVSRVRNPIWVFDIDNGCISWANEGSLRLWNADSLEDLLSRNMAADMSATVAKRLRQYQADFKRDEDAHFREIWTLYPNDEPQTLEVVFSGIRLPDGRMAMFCEVMQQQDMSAESLRSSEALLHTSVMITLYSAQGEPLYRNPAARSVTRSSDQTLSNHFDNPGMMSMLHGASGDEVKIVTPVSTVNGSRYHDITARRCLDAVSGKHAWLISEVDVSRLKATEERAQFLAEHDMLTQLPNRNYVSSGFQIQIDMMLARGESGALLFLDLDHFKDINDSLGHDAGDQLLIEIAHRLSSLVSGDDCVARLGGDEFLILLGGLAHGDDLAKLTKRLIQSIAEPVILQGRQMRVTPSIGVSLFPENGRKIDDLMRHADLAMYHSKESGRNSVSFFTQDLSDAVTRRIALESELLEALEKGQFETYFQPRVSVNDNQIVGAEALVRWNHPERGLLPPDMFIPVCESTGLIGRLGMIVLEHSICAQRNWANMGHRLRLSINLSPLQFGDASMVDDVVGLVTKHQGNIEDLELEITESVLLGHDQATIDKLHALVDHGFRIAIDDFGTGYSNLAYLHRYPIRCLKIDRTFIQAHDSAQPIIKLILSMAKLFDFDVIAEGVETEQQLQALQAMGCQEYQGYFFEKPMPYGDFTQLLRQHQLRQCA